MAITVELQRLQMLVSVDKHFKVTMSEWLKQMGAGGRDGKGRKDG